METLNYVLLAFALVAAVDRIFGSRLGLGADFEKGVSMAGPLILTIGGMLILPPAISGWICVFYVQDTGHWQGAGCRYLTSKPLRLYKKLCVMPFGHHAFFVDCTIAASSDSTGCKPNNLRHG